MLLPRTFCPVRPRPGKDRVGLTALETGDTAVKWHSQITRELGSRGRRPQDPWAGAPRTARALGRLPRGRRPRAPPWGPFGGCWARRSKHKARGQGSKGRGGGRRTARRAPARHTPPGGQPRTCLPERAPHEEPISVATELDHVRGGTTTCLLCWKNYAKKRKNKDSCAPPPGRARARADAPTQLQLPGSGA